MSGNHNGDINRAFRILEAAKAAGADAVKFATLLRSAADLAILAAMQESAAVPLASMGMGPLGRVSLLLLAHLGSILNYGYLDQPTIPGQWPAQRLRDLIAELRPK
jgi:3-dehydroquinate dehydratase-1